MKDEKGKEKRRPWVRKRHRVSFFFFYWIVWLMCKVMYGLRYEKRKDGRQYLILFNHQTPFDQFFPCMMFRGTIYFVTSEDIISKGWVSRLLDFLFAPIPIKKQMTDLKAVRNCLQVAREGGTIAMAPEGNRTYSGLTCDINPAVTKLSKKMGIPIALVRFEGGYGLQPRWSNKRRISKKYPWMEARIARILEPEEIKAMSDEELLQAVKDGLYQDDAEYVKRTGQRYFHRRNAEYLERVLYVCPECGLSRFYSEKKEVRCEKCGSSYKLLPDLTLEKTKESGRGFTTVGEWFEYQQDYIRGLDLSVLPKDKPLYEDRGQFSHVVLESHKEILREDALIRLYPDRITIGEDEAPAGVSEDGGKDGFPKVFPFSDVLAASAVGRNKLNVYLGRELYQVKADVRFNAVKYVNLFYRYKNMEKGDHSHEQFLGL